MKNPVSKLLASITILFLCPFLSMAQGDPPPDTLDTPLDAWVVVLIVAGILYGVKMVWFTGRMKKKFSANDNRI